MAGCDDAHPLHPGWPSLTRSWRSTVEARELRLPDGSGIPFTIDAFARRMILDGTGGLGYPLRLEP